MLIFSKHFERRRALLELEHQRRLDEINREFELKRQENDRIYKPLIEALGRFIVTLAQSQVSSTKG